MPRSRERGGTRMLHTAWVADWDKIFGYRQ